MPVVCLSYVCALVRWPVCRFTFPLLLFPQPFCRPPGLAFPLSPSWVFSRLLSQRSHTHTHTILCMLVDVLSHVRLAVIKTGGTLIFISFFSLPRCCVCVCVCVCATVFDHLAPLLFASTLHSSFIGRTFSFCSLPSTPLSLQSPLVSPLSAYSPSHLSPFAQ